MLLTSDAFTLFCTCASRLLLPSSCILTQLPYCHFYDVLFCAAHLFCQADTLLSYVVVKFVSNLCLILRVSCVFVSPLGACLAGPRGEGGEIGTPAWLHSPPRHLSALSSPSFLFLHTFPFRQFKHMLWLENQSKRWSYSTKLLFWLAMILGLHSYL